MKLVIIFICILIITILAILVGFEYVQRYNNEKINIIIKDNNLLNHIKSCTFLYSFNQFTYEIALKNNTILEMDNINLIGKQLFKDLQNDCSISNDCSFYLPYDKKRYYSLSEIYIRCQQILKTDKIIIGYNYCKIMNNEPNITGLWFESKCG